jgi:hypothetical protein
MGWTIDYYTETGGTCPVEEFIDSISPEAQARFIFVADLLEEYGIAVKAPYVKSISGQKKLFEKNLLFHVHRQNVGSALQKGQRRPLVERLRLP